jgi:hypothetical protein
MSSNPTARLPDQVAEVSSGSFTFSLARSSSPLTSVNVFLPAAGYLHVPASLGYTDEQQTSHSYDDTSFISISWFF